MTTPQQQPTYRPPHAHYERPTLTVIGTLAELTLGPTHGTHADGFGFAIHVSTR
jgi:hypothetical protein